MEGHEPVRIKNEAEARRLYVAITDQVTKFVICKVALEQDQRVVGLPLPLNFGHHRADVVVEPGDFVVVQGQVLADLRHVRQIRRDNGVLGPVWLGDRSLLVIAVRIQGRQPEEKGPVTWPVPEHGHPLVAPALHTEPIKSPARMIVRISPRQSIHGVG